MTTALVGGFYTAIAPTLGDGQGYPLRLTSAGLLMVNAASVGPVAGADAPADARANPTTDVPTTAFLEAFNGTTWDRVRCGAVDATHAAPALGAVDGRAHGYGREAGGTWEAILTGAQPATYTARTFGAGTQSTASQMFGTDGGLIRPLLMNASVGALFAATYSSAPSGNGVATQVNTQGRTFVLASLPWPADTVNDPSLSNTVDDNAVTAKASAGWLLSAFGTNEGIAGYFQIFNKASDPVAGDVPVFSIPVRSGVSGAADWKIDRTMLADTGKRFSTGIAYGWSSTRATHTPLAYTGTANVLYS